MTHRTGKVNEEREGKEVVYNLEDDWSDYDSEGEGYDPESDTDAQDQKDLYSSPLMEINEISYLKDAISKLDNKTFDIYFANVSESIKKDLEKCFEFA